MVPGARSKNHLQAARYTEDFFAYLARKSVFVDVGEY